MTALDAPMGLYQRRDGMLVKLGLFSMALSV